MHQLHLILAVNIGWNLFVFVLVLHNNSLTSMRQIAARQQTSTRPRITHDAYGIPNPDTTRGTSWGANQSLLVAELSTCFDTRPFSSRLVLLQ